LGQALILLPFYLQDTNTYTYVEMFHFTIAYYLANLGSICLTLGVKYGKGGIVQSIESLKAVW